MKEEFLELQSQLWSDNYRSFIENERVASIEYDKHIFQFCILLITGLCYVISQTYSSHPHLSLVFVLPIVLCVATIFCMLFLYRNNFLRISKSKTLYDRIFLFDQHDNKELEKEITKYESKNLAYSKWSWLWLCTSVFSIAIAFVIFYVFSSNILDKFQNTHTLSTTNTYIYVRGN